MSQDKVIKELEVLTNPNNVDITLSTGEVILVNTIRLKELPKFTSIVKKILPNTSSLQNVEDINVLELILNNTEDMIDLILLCSKLEKPKSEDLDLEDLILLATAVVEVNLSFFIAKVLPALGQAATKIEARIQQLGQK